MENFAQMIGSNRIISAIRDKELLIPALESHSQVVFLLSSSLESIKEQTALVRKYGKKVFVHFDLMEGIKRDSAGLSFLVDYAGIDGIITTHSSMVKIAKDKGINSIQRLFLLDGVSVKTGISSIKRINPDAIEIMPGTISSTISEMSKEVDMPIIAGGLIKREAEVKSALGAGALCVSTSCVDLWNL